MTETGMMTGMGTGMGMTMVTHSCTERGVDSVVGRIQQRRLLLLRLLVSLEVFKTNQVLRLPLRLLLLQRQQQPPKVMPMVGILCFMGPLLTSGTQMLWLRHRHIAMPLSGTSSTRGSGN